MTALPASCLDGELIASLVSLTCLHTIHDKRKTNYDGWSGSNPSRSCALFPKIRGFYISRILFRGTKTRSPFFCKILACCLKVENPSCEGSGTVFDVLNVHYGSKFLPISWICTKISSFWRDIRSNGYFPRNEWFSRWRQGCKLIPMLRNFIQRWL